jgi:hypothetical protein
MMRALPSVVDTRLVPKLKRDHGNPPPDARKYSEELLCYLIKHYKRFELASSQGKLYEFEDDSDVEQDHDWSLAAAIERAHKWKSRDARAKKRHPASAYYAFVLDCEELCSVMNGDWSNTAHIEHYCDGWPGCDLLLGSHQHDFFQDMRTACFDVKSIPPWRTGAGEYWIGFGAFSRTGDGDHLLPVPSGIRFSGCLGGGGVGEFKSHNIGGRGLQTGRA